MRVINDMLDAYSRIEPRDLRDTEAYLSRMTADALINLTRVRMDDNAPPAAWTGQEKLLGLPIRIDDNLPYGVVEFKTETEMDRAIRRATRDGRTVNIMKPLPFPAAFLPEPPPAPTLKALLKHWWRKVKR